MQSALTREYRKMFRNLNGIRTMNRLPECLVVIDPKKEKNAISEARKLGITTVALIDTDCDPDLVDLPIPGNDDSIRSIELVVQQLADAMLEGKAQPSTSGRDCSKAAMAEESAGRPAPTTEASVEQSRPRPAVAYWREPDRCVRRCCRRRPQRRLACRGSPRSIEHRYQQSADARR